MLTRACAGARGLRRAPQLRLLRTVYDKAVQDSKVPPLRRLQAPFFGAQAPPGACRIGRLRPPGPGMQCKGLTWERAGRPACQVCTSGCMARAHWMRLHCTWVRGALRKLRVCMVWSSERHRRLAGGDGVGMWGKG